MKNQILKILVLIFFTSCGQVVNKTSDKGVLNNLEQIVEVQDYFKLKKYFEANKTKLSKTHELYYGAIINNVFNHSGESNNAIKELLAVHNNSLNDTLMNKLYRTKLMNHINLYEYSLATTTSDYIQQNFLELTDSSDIEMLQNEINIWRALENVPKQQIIRNQDCIIPMKRDKVGLFNVDVNFGDSTKNFLFDTGANFSAITRSLVDELGLTLIEADFYVTAATGLQVNCDIAIAEEFELGGLICKNVVFLVLNDEDLSFPQIDYYPNGAIGFPVIEAFDELRINRENEIFIPMQPTVYSFNNFALDGLMPIVACEYEGDTLSLHFDTGATSTTLFSSFYEDYQQEIQQHHKKQSFKSGSAGGTYTFEGYVLNNIHLKVANSEVTLDSVRLHIENIGDDESNFHGNFGQDYIKQFDEMILSFKYASVLFK